VLKGHPGCGKRGTVQAVCAAHERVQLTCMDAVDTWPDALKFMTNGTAAGGNKLSAQLNKFRGIAEDKPPPALRVWYFHDLQPREPRDSGSHDGKPGKPGTTTASAVGALVRAATARPCALPGVVVVGVHDYTPQTMLLRTCGSIDSAQFSTKEFDHRQRKILRSVSATQHQPRARIQPHDRPWVARVARVAGGVAGAAALQRLCVQAAAVAEAAAEASVPPPAPCVSPDDWWHTVQVLDCIPSSGGFAVRVLVHDHDHDDGHGTVATWANATAEQLQTGFAALRRTKGRADGQCAVAVRVQLEVPFAQFNFCVLRDDGEPCGDYILELHRLVLHTRQTEARHALVQLQSALRACTTPASTDAAHQACARYLRTQTILTAAETDALLAAARDLSCCAALLKQVHDGRPFRFLSVSMAMEVVQVPADAAAATVALLPQVAAPSSVHAAATVPNDVYVAARTPFAATTWLLRAPRRDFVAEVRSVALLRDTYGATMVLDMFWGAWAAQVGSAKAVVKIADVLAARSLSEQEHASSAGAGAPSNSLANVPVSMLAVLAVVRGRVVLPTTSPSTPTPTAFVPVLTGPTFNSRRAVRLELQAVATTELATRNAAVMRETAACTAASVPPPPVLRFATEWVL
jgi:hypothetical protein